MLMLRPSLALALASLAGCIEHSPGFYNITDEAPNTTTSDASSFPEQTTSDAPTSDISTTSDGTTGASTTTGGSTAGASTTVGEAGTDATGEPENAKPEIYGFSASPTAIYEPGAVILVLDASPDVIDVDVWYGATLLGTVPAAAFPYSFDVTSQSMCDGPQTFTATVRDAEGLTATSPPADLFCQLPAPGSQVYTRTLEGLTSANGTAITLLPDGGIVAAGALDGRMMLWRLDVAGDPVAGWPKTLADWTLVPGLDAKESSATAVAVDSGGKFIVIAGFVKNGIAFRRYVAKLSDKGVLLWEDDGQVDGEEVMGLAVSAAGDIVTAGSLRTSPLDKEPAYDAVTVGYTGGVKANRWPRVFVKPATDPKPDMDNFDSERWRGVIAFANGHFLVFGERDYWDGDDLNTLFTRTTMVEVSADGVIGETWTSPGSQYANDAALAGTLTDAGFAFTGWCRHDGPNDKRQACIQTFDGDGKPGQTYVEPWPTQTAGLGVAQDRMKRLVVAGYKTKPGELDAWVFASIGAGYSPAWQQPPGNQGGWDFAAGVVCEAWGKCTSVGSTTIDGHLAVVVSQRYP